MKTCFSHSEAETKKFGETVAKKLRGEEVIALFGELGAGKTCFTRALARSLRIRHPITSPTFTFLKSYRFKKNRQIFTLYHFDLYRLRGVSELEGLGFFEALKQKRRVIVIEWPEKITSALPKNCLKIHFIYGKKENQRTIRWAGELPAGSTKP
jgi:tRNA threonylcarbamoyladenosine biosynthesis protein TsaE